MKIRDRVHRLGDDGLVNAYLIVENGEVTIVDAAMPGDWRVLIQELHSIDRSLDDVRALVLTHGHSDHIGFAERARSGGVPVSVHELDAALARGEVRNPAKGGGPVKPIPLLRFLARGVTRGGIRTKRLTAVETFGDGAALDVPGALRVMLVPGHTPGSVVLHAPAYDTLFVGDALATVAVTNGSTGPMIAPFSADPAQAAASLERIEGIEAGWLLPGHGQPWTGGVAEAVRRVRAAGANGMGR